MPNPAYKRRYFNHKDEEHQEPATGKAEGLVWKMHTLQTRWHGVAKAHFRQRIRADALSGSPIHN